MQSDRPIRLASKILYLIAYVVLVIPLATILRVLGVDLLQQRKKRHSMWRHTDRPVAERQAEDSSGIQSKS